MEILENNWYDMLPMKDEEDEDMCAGFYYYLFFFFFLNVTELFQAFSVYFYLGKPD